MTKAATKKAPAKDAKEPTEKKARRSRHSDLYPEDAKITMLAEGNPKKVGSKSHARFEGYTGATTVGDALAAGVTYADIIHDVGHQFISVG